MQIYQTQDPKYSIVDGSLVNTATGLKLDPNMPVFMLLAKDVNAIATLLFYRDRTKAGEHRDAVDLRLNEFAAFKDQFPELMKVPDTTITKEFNRRQLDLGLDHPLRQTISAEKAIDIAISMPDGVDFLKHWRANEFCDIELKWPSIISQHPLLRMPT